MKNFLGIIFFFFLYPFFSSFSQNISAYVDYKNYFYAFDEGVSKQLEFNPVQSYKIGGNAIGYVDNSGTVKIYYNGEINDLRVQSPQEIVATDDLIFIYCAKVLKVFDRGEVNVVSPSTNSFFPGDSLVGFYDNNSYAFKVYYKKEILTLEDYIGGESRR